MRHRLESLGFDSPRYARQVSAPSPATLSVQSSKIQPRSHLMGSAISLLNPDGCETSEYSKSERESTGPNWLKHRCRSIARQFHQMAEDSRQTKFRCAVTPNSPGEQTNRTIAQTPGDLRLPLFKGKRNFIRENRLQLGCHSMSQVVNTLGFLRKCDKYMGPDSKQKLAQKQQEVAHMKKQHNQKLAETLYLKTVWRKKLHEAHEKLQLKLSRCSLKNHIKQSELVKSTQTSRELQKLKIMELKDKNWFSLNMANSLSHLALATAHDRLREQRDGENSARSLRVSEQKCKRRSWKAEEQRPKPISSILNIRKDAIQSRNRQLTERAAETRVQSIRELFNLQKRLVIAQKQRSDSALRRVATLQKSHSELIGLKLHSTEISFVPLTEVCDE
ncbi:unnamed protein product [Calicophoron daubneyi]|uniref:Uncharacterized protein n=1 Tax=Calicophoron daubneyi TaxID=300641 RepID=A0AAV2TSE8_CALDB